MTSIPHWLASPVAHGDADSVTSRHRPAKTADSGIALLDAYRTLTLSRRLLRFLLVARLTVALCGLALTAILNYRAGAAFPLLEVGELLLGAGLLTWLAWHRLIRRSVIFENDYLVQLLGDIALLTYALVLSGGHENPFDHFFLLPLVLAAYALSWRRVSIVILAGLAGWLTVSVVHAPAPPFEQWVGVLAHVLLATIVTYFAYAMASISLRHERAVAQRREDALERRNARAMQTVAAQAAHAISTPLATMAVVLREMGEEDLAAGDRQQAIQMLSCQVQTCKDKLSDLIASVGDSRGQEARSMGIDAFVRAASDECQLMDPAATVLLDAAGLRPAPVIVVERSLVDAVVLAIEDCASGPQQSVNVQARWDAARLTMTITGDGGWADSQMEFPAAREDGTWQRPAAGEESLSLAAKLLERFGASMTFRPGTPGKWLQITLPLTNLRRMP